MNFDIPWIIASHGVALLLLLILLLDSRKMALSGSLDSSVYRLMVYLAIIQCFVETFTYLIDGIIFPGSYIMNLISDSLLYINNTLFAFIWSVYVDLKVLDKFDNLRKHILLTATPAALIIILSLVNLFTPVFYQVDRVTNIYQRTSLYWLPNVVVAFYFFYTVILALEKCKQTKRDIFFPIMVFLAPITIGVILEYAFYGLTLIWLCSAISLTSIYISLQNQISYTDSLSGLLTRQYMVNYLLSEMSQTSSRKLLTGIMIDIDNFKSINDTWGHVVGDEAIRAVGQILRKASSKSTVAIRFGGDEFIVLQTADDERNTQETMQRILKGTDDYNADSKQPFILSLSLGSAVCDRQSDTLDSFFMKMDAAMYHDKSKKKHSRYYRG